MAATTAASKDIKIRVFLKLERILWSRGSIEKFITLFLFFFGLFFLDFLDLLFGTGDFRLGVREKVFGLGWTTFAGQLTGDGADIDPD